MKIKTTNGEEVPVKFYDSLYDYIEDPVFDELPEHFTGILEYVPERSSMFLYYHPKYPDLPEEVSINGIKYHLVNFGEDWISYLKEDERSEAVYLLMEDGAVWGICPTYEEAEKKQQQG